MTLGEVYAVIWARTRNQRGKRDELAEMYDDLQEALGKA